ncbi:uncharacterized protein ELE39_002317 [Cryptosporidium sp. chipmunk genotype I]|uniref:uncharacterized protein n=1 Tax=Cryptosporidium sp. chipmunk genotype I TaxID=1280935 RepID=UPI00351AAF5A|nr:hypothetical protein ELE39_002317 [Cryptosporidium sp. chipmunk genotype I]
MEVFEIFIIRYINYINIWSIELTSENFYEEFRDGILLVNLLKQWSGLYGYNSTEGDLVIYKRPLNRSQALNNINLCLNFILNPPEKSKLPEYLNLNNELIAAEEIYDMNEKNVIRFISTVFHHYLIPYLRLNSKMIIENINKYLMLHGLSFSDETKENFYKMIIKGNINQVEDEDLLERAESWERYLNLNIKVMDDQNQLKTNLINLNEEEEEQEKRYIDLNTYKYVKMGEKNNMKSDEVRNFEPKYINPLQCDITSNGFMLIMVLLYQMGWIDTAILCQMYYVPKTLEEFKWNHEIVYYSFQTINQYLSIQKELSIVNHHSSNTKFESNFLNKENESDDETVTNITNCEIPFILVPLSSLYMENFSPYVLLLQIDILHNLLTQQIDSNYDVTSYSSNRLAVYGPYQPINLELLDELTYKDDYPLNWTMSNCETSPKDLLEEVKEEECEIEQIDHYDYEHGKDDPVLLKNAKQSEVSLHLNMVKTKSCNKKNTSRISDHNLARLEALLSQSNMINANSIKESEENNSTHAQDNFDNEHDDDYVVGSMYEYLQDKEKEIETENVVNNLYGNDIEEEPEYDIGYNYNDNISNNQTEKNMKSKKSNNSLDDQKNYNKNRYHHHLNEKVDQAVEGGDMDEMFTGLEKELEILKIYDENNYNEKLSNKNNQKNQNEINNTKNITQIFQEKMASNTREFKEKFSHILNKEENKHQNKVKPLISRTALEEQQKKILGMASDDNDYASKVFDITRKQSDGVIEKISTAISENNKLLEKLKMSMNVQNNNSQSEIKSNLLKESGENNGFVSTDKNTREMVFNPIESKENNKPANIELNSEIKVKNLDTPKKPLSNSENLNNVTVQKVSRKKKANKVSFSDLVQMEVERATKKI